MSMVSIERHGTVAVVRYDRGGKANALNLAAMDALIDAASQLAEDDQIRAVVLTGTPAIFSAGIDLKDPALWAHDDPLATQRALARGEALCRAWSELPQVTIAAIEGAAVGGGAVLALACDWRALGANAFLRLPEVRLGLPLAWGGLPRLASLAGPARAKRALFTDFKLDADTAEQWGVADIVAPEGAVVQAALALAREAAACPALATRLTKRAIDAQFDASRHAHAQTDQFLLCHLLSPPTASQTPATARAHPINP
ncbi:enoyl-CoA hydratase/isomerase family protein [Achromobacter seleniivolatilans]|uniref:Enoyl-CoA hydratase/isomerase family protein n=1 Tax=Achromobacter seleniivolatilans TaxID=3047478 RepID=A0ABY9LYI0_9BURK|nr:enoyl-CoA hydratase/isomerase family protein [Achromobacter sp. R39]WMD19745.1 enoyl-CoA hydratase/isomerase family protein [Achromobacter sp. R39]